MWHDYKDLNLDGSFSQEETEAESPFTKRRPAKYPEGEWRRIKRKIYSPFWRGVHNLIAHPMLAIHRPTGERLHAYTAEKMYKPRPGVQPIESDSD